MRRLRRALRRVFRPYRAGYESGRADGYEYALRDAEAVTQAAVRVAAASGTTVEECTNAIIATLRSYR